MNHKGTEDTKREFSISLSLWFHCAVDERSQTTPTTLTNPEIHPQKSEAGLAYPTVVFEDIYTRGVFPITFFLWY